MKKSMKVTKKDIQKIKPETFWVIAWGRDFNGNTGYLMPWISGRTRNEAIQEALSHLSGLISGTWKEMYQDGLRAVKVKISVLK